MDDSEVVPLLQLENGWEESEFGVAQHNPALRRGPCSRLVVGAQPDGDVRHSTQIPRSSLLFFTPFSISRANPSPSQNNSQIQDFHPETEGIILHPILETISERSSPVSTMPSLRIKKSSSTEDKAWLTASESTCPSSPNLPQPHPVMDNT